MSFEADAFQPDAFQFDTPGALPTYRLALAERSATGLGDEIIADVLAVGVPTGQYACRWTKGLNTAGTIEFTLPFDVITKEDFAPGQRELHLYRDEVLVWAGHLWTADVRLPWVRFLGMGWYEALRHREVADDIYRLETEQLDLAWELIDYTQTKFDYGDLGITRGAASDSGVVRTIELCAEGRDNVADAIEDLAAADDGFDFEVSPDKVWNVYYPARGGDLSAVELDTSTNVRDISYTVDATQVENEVAGVGKREDCEPIHYARVSDVESQSAYGLMQGTVSRPDIGQDNDLIDGLIAARLALLSIPRHQPAIRLHQSLGGPSVLEGDFDLGDVITLTSAWGYATFSGAFRVFSYTVSFDRIGHESVELTLNEVPV